MTAITSPPALRAVRLQSTSPELEDLVFFDAIGVKEKVGEDFIVQATALFNKVEDMLKQVDMTKSHIVDVKSTFTDLGSDLVKFNELYDSWMTGVEIVPTQTACQLLPFDAEQPKIVMSITATKATKQQVGSSRAGGGAPAMMIPAKDAAYPEQPMHFPWSNIIQAGDVAWVAGFLNVQDGTDMPSQVRGTMKRISTALSEVGLTPDDILNSEVLIPEDLSEEDYAKLDEIYGKEFLASSRSPHIQVQRVCRTCAGCKVEITVMASKSANIKIP
jgi:enamine deaminase RidA (YjgF/YER057c/UK114 family)